MQTYGGLARELRDIPDVWQDNHVTADVTMHSQIYCEIARVSKI